MWNVPWFGDGLHWRNEGAWLCRTNQHREAWASHRPMLTLLVWWVRNSARHHQHLAGVHFLFMRQQRLRWNRQLNHIRPSRHFVRPWSWCGSRGGSGFESTPVLLAYLWLKCVLWFSCHLKPPRCSCLVDFRLCFILQLLEHSLSAQNYFSLRRFHLVYRPPRSGILRPRLEPRFWALWLWALLRLFSFWLVSFRHRCPIRLACS